MFKRYMFLACLLHLLLTTTVPGQESSTNPTGGPDVNSAVYDVLYQADQAIKNLESIRYDAFFEGTGSVAVWRPSTKGQVLLARTLEKSPDVRIQCTSGRTRGLEGTIRDYDLVMRKNRVKEFNHEKREVVFGASGLFALGPGFDLIVREFNHPEPFQEEMQESVATLEGRAYVEGVLCDVVMVNYHRGAERRWYFSVEDHLPRRMIRMRYVDEVPGALVLTLSNVEVNVEIDEDTFKPADPEGYARKRASPSKGQDRMYLAPEPKRDPDKP